MSRHGQDQRVRRTRGWIVESFGGLVLDRPYESINVGDIVGKAGVGRSTFYEHFHNKDALLLHAVSAPLSALAGAVTDPGEVAPVRQVLEHFWENRRRALELLTGPSAAQVSRRHAELIAARLSVLCRERGVGLTIPVGLGAVQIADGQLGIIRAWLEGVEACTASELAFAICRGAESAVASICAEPA